MDKYIKRHIDALPTEQKEVEKGIFLRALARYNTPHGHSNPQTFAYAEGYKEGLVIADSNAQANKEACELVWHFRNKIKELVENLEAEVSEYRKQSKMRKATREEKDINAGLIMAKVDAIAALRPLLLREEKPEECDANTLNQGNTADNQ
jgi:hypothetical protein